MVNGYKCITYKAKTELNPTPNLPPYSTPIVCAQILPLMSETQSLGKRN